MNYWLGAVSVCVLFVLAVLAAPLQSYASYVDQTFVQQIYPVDCVLDEINDGLNTQSAITPYKCHSVIPAQQPKNEPAKRTNLRQRSSARSGNALASSEPMLASKSNLAAAANSGTAKKNKHFSGKVQNQDGQQSWLEGDFLVIGAISAILAFSWWLIIGRRRRRKNNDAET